MPKLKVYVSSSYPDLKDYRRVVIDTLDDLGYEPWAMEKYSAADEPSLDLCLADVAQCDLYIGIVAWRYGSIPQGNNPDGRSITECEWRAARTRIQCLFFLSDDQPGKWPSDSLEDYRRAEQLREELKREHSLAHFDSPDKLRSEIIKAVTKWAEKPDFGTYLDGLKTDFSALPAIPNDTKRLALADTIKIRVAFAGKPHDGSGEGQPRTTVLDLFGAVAQEPVWLLVGEAGQGKTTALRSLAHHFAKEWLDARQRRETTGGGPSSPLVPIYMSLSHQPRSLREQIRDALQWPGFTCSMDVVDRWMQSQPFLFLIDRLDETDADVVLEDLQNVARYATKSRFVVASRPSAALARCPWPQARIEPLSHYDIRSLCETLLGTARGSELCDTLVQNGLLDAFRRPLFARLLALSSPDLLARNRFTRSEVFRDVLEKRFLGSWERAADSHFERDLLKELAAWVAHEMVAKSVYVINQETTLQKAVTLARRRGIRGDMRDAEELLKKMAQHGIVQEHDGEVQFWHTSFRDYFAAVWMEQHASALSIYVRSWQPRWHEALLFYFGLLHGRSLRRRLRELLMGSRESVALLSMWPSPPLSSRLFLVLRCLAEVGSEHEELQRRFIAMCPVQFSYFYLYLSAERVTERYPSPSDYIGHSAFCDLIGQFRIPEAFAYLNRVQASFPTVAAGLMHEGTDHIYNRMVDWLADSDDANRTANDQDHNGRLAIAELILRSPDERFVKPMIDVLTADGVAAKSNLLAALNWWFGRNFGNDDDLVHKRLMNHLQATLIDLVLYQEDEGLRKTVVSLFHRMDGTLSKVPAPATAAFIEALNDSRADVRERALSGLLWGPLREHMDIAWRLLRDPSLLIVARTLYFFQVMDHAHFPLAVLRVVRRHAPMGSELRQVANHLVAALDLEHPDPNWRRQSISLLIAAAFFGQYNFLRRDSINVLGTFRLSWTAPMLLSILRGDEWIETRCAAFRALVHILGKKATALVVDGLDSEETEMLECAVRACAGDGFDIEWRPFAGHKLFRLLKNPDNLIGGSAARTLREWGYLEKEWNWYLYGETLGTDPIYLGPTSDDSFAVPDHADTV